MMTTSNPRGSSLNSNEGQNRERVFKFKSLLVIFTILSFTITLSSQNNDQYSTQDLQNFKVKWMNDHNLNELSPAQNEQMKSEWILSKDPVRSVKIEDDEPFDANRQKKMEEWQGKNFYSGFPVIEHTGDLEKDQAIYDAKKQLWIEKNPDLYQQMINNSGKMTEAERKERIETLNQ